MSGSSSVRGDQTVYHTDNLCFDGTDRDSPMSVDGQLWIGATTSNRPNNGGHVRLGQLISPNGSITFGYSSPNITATVTGGAMTIQTITGNTGGAIAPVAGNINLITSNATIGFAGTAGTETLDFNLTNLVLGSSLPSNITAVNNVGLGNNIMGTITTGDENTAMGTAVLQAITSGGSNTCIGYQTGNDITSASFNTLIGTQAGLNVTTGGSNVAVGFQALPVFTSGSGSSGSNIAIGGTSLGNLLTGTNNIALGSTSALNYTSSESSNIIISAAGTVGESNKIRIGTAGSGTGQQNQCFIAGITGVTAAGALVNVASTGQLAAIAEGTAGQVLISNGAGVSPSFQSGGLVFSDVTATTLVSDHGYFATAAGTYVLPASPTQGDLIIIVADTAGAVVVDAPSTHLIRIGSSITGAGGTLTSTAIGDSLTLRYRASTTTWMTVSSMGNWTVA